MALPSMNSRAQGVAGCAMMAATAPAAAFMSGYTARSVRRAGWMGVSFRVASVMTASVPSEPISSRVRSYPTTPLVVETPVRISSPPAVTARRPRVFSRGVPYLTARGPAELYARLPPTVHTAALVGSGGQKKPWAAAASCTSWLVTPGSTTINRFAGSIRSIRFMRSRARTRALSRGTVAPVVPVPRPRATTGMRASLHRRRMARIWSCRRGKATAPGRAWRRLLS